MLIEFFHMGLAHIGASVSEWMGPHGFHFPGGIDHLLFLLALALVCDTYTQVLKTATGFTLGHSLTLALATLHIIEPSSRWVESAIALSIAYLAAESLLGIKSGQRWKIAALCGLVHGFGFASALQESEFTQHSLVSALVGFNLGIEVGQVFILLALFPIIREMRKEPLLRFYGLKSCSLAVFSTATYWFVVRAFG